MNTHIKKKKKKAAFIAPCDKATLTAAFLLFSCG